MPERNEGIMAAILGVAVVVIGVVSVIALAVIAGALAQGFVLHKLWGWFIEPKFALPPLGVAEAFALMLVVKLVTGKALEQGEDKAKEEGFEAAGKAVGRFGMFLLGCGIVLLMGWILTFFVSYPA